MANPENQHARYLEMGRAAVCIRCPDAAFADTADRHIFLSPSFDGPFVATIQYTPDDTVEDLLPFERKDNVVYIDRKAMPGGFERIVLGMFNAFTAVLELQDDNIVVRYGSHAPVQTLLDDVLQVALQPVLDRQGGFILHGACMVREGRAIVLMGNSGAGKSTTAFNLKRYGFTGYADDAVLVTPYDGALTVWPLTRELSLRPLSFTFFERQGIPLGDYQKAGDKYYFAQTSQLPPGASLEYICFLNLSGESKTHIERLTRDKALEILDANNRHFSFMGRSDAHKYARILTRDVPTPLQASLGTDLEYQGALFESLFSGHEPHTPTAEPIESIGLSRADKAALIRMAWTAPNQEPLAELIPLLGDFDPTIFKLALGFFQTYPLAGLTPLDAPEALAIDQPYDSAPWVRATDWANGSQMLVQQTGVEVLQKFAYSWLKSAPLLYPFLKALLVEDLQSSDLLDQAWNKVSVGDDIGRTVQCHLLNFNAPHTWSQPEADHWWLKALPSGQSTLQLYCWISESAPMGDKYLPSWFGDMPEGSIVTIVPVINGRREIQTSIEMVQMVMTQGVSASLCRQVPLCRMSEAQALFLLEAGALNPSGKAAADETVFLKQPGHTPVNDIAGNRFGMVWPKSCIRYNRQPYARCTTCRQYGLGLCRGGFFGHE